jgi:hypothetical protein
MASEIKVDTISENTSANGVTIDGVNIKDGQVDGVDVSAINQAGLVFLSSQVVTDSDSDVSALTFDNVFSSTYDNYKIIVNDLMPDTGEQKLRLSYRTGSSGSNADYTSNTIDFHAMFHRTVKADLTGDPTASGYEGVDTNYVECFGVVSDAYVGGIVHTLELYNAYTTPNTNSRHMGWYHSIHVSSTELQQRWGSWIQDDASNTNTGFKLYLASNNISTASVQVYGYRKS